jgi:hypothetical protein
MLRERVPPDGAIVSPSWSLMFPVPLREGLANSRNRRPSFAQRMVEEPSAVLKRDENCELGGYGSVNALMLPRESCCHHSDSHKFA